MFNTQSYDESTQPLDPNTVQSLTRFLIFSMVILAIFSIFNIISELYLVACLQISVLLSLPIPMRWLKRGSHPTLVRHIIGFNSLVIFAPLAFIPTIENTGIYWVFGYPLVTFFFLGSRLGTLWTSIYCIALLTGFILAVFGYLELYYTITQFSLSVVEMLVFSALGYLFVTDRERATHQKQLHLNYLESIERLERALNQTSDMSHSLNQALDCLLKIFQCHRAWLLTPCDPHAASWNVPFERTTPDYPGLFPSAQGMPITPEVQAFFRENLQSTQPRSNDSTLPMLDNDIMRAYSIQSQLVIALTLDHDTHWLLGLHQCDHVREWSNSEKKLFQDCANRMQDALNQMILYQQLKKSEQQLRQAIKQADAANHAKSEFLSLMSHELRTPLHGIIGLQELLFNDSENLSDEQKEYIQLSQQAGQSLRSLVNDILDLSKAESGHAVAAQKSFDPLNCLRDVLVPFIAIAKQKGIELSLQLDHVPTQIIGDSPRLRQSLLNLVGNAIKFTQQGFVRIHVSHSMQDGKPQLIFSVRDSGCGIAPEYMEFLFEPFTQANTLMTPEHEGTGLGTTIVKRFVELMGGSITVTSTLGQGSCFSFNIPCQADSNMVYLQKLQASNIAAFINDTHSKSINSTQNLRVLLAEDDLISQRIAVKSMQRAGIQVTVASNGQEAWDELQQHDYDLLLTDIRMPKLSGIELTQRIREAESHYSRPKLPIIGFSAHAMEEVERQCKAAGMNDFMTKPIEPEAIVKRILGVCRT